MSSVARHGDWILTYTGKEFWPLDCRPEDIDIQDIAVALSRLNRFTGHTRFAYSVGQHSIYVAEEILKQTKNRRTALAGLLHDASEAYISDISSPLKQLEEFKTFRAIEKILQKTIYKTFGLRLSKQENKDIHLVDRQMFTTEVLQLMPANKTLLKKISQYTPINRQIDQQEDKVVEERFLQLFAELQLV